MTNDKFNAIIKEQLTYCDELLRTKNVEYHGEIDRLHTFKAAGAMEGTTPRQALSGMMAKHTISIYDMCKGGDYSVEKWTEKITDHINYLLLLKAVIMEEKENEKN